MPRERPTRRRVLKVTGAFGAVGATSLAGCTDLTGGGGDGGGGGGGKLTIGMCNSLTGSLSTFGERNKRGKQLARADVNAVGVRGGQLEILVEDTQSKPQPGVSAAQKLVNQNDVPILVGAVSSGVSLSIFQSVRACHRMILVVVTVIGVSCFKVVKSILPAVVHSELNHGKSARKISFSE